MKVNNSDNNLFSEHRKRFVSQMRDNSMAIFISNPEITSNGDALYEFKQNTDLLWLTGINQINTYCVLIRNSKKDFQEFVFVQEPNPLKEIWDGKFLTKEEVTQYSKIENVKYNDEFDSFLQVNLNSLETIYLNTNENDRKIEGHITPDYLFIQKIKNKYPLHKYERSAVILKQERAIKNKYEIEIIQKAIDITEYTFKKVLQMIKPDIYEYEIGAEMLYYFLKQGGKGFGFSPIIASGDNARTLHYIENKDKCKDGDLVLMDFGVYYGYYNSDITRTVPVNGVFTKRQREIYNACLQIHNYAESLLKPGVLLTKYTERVGDIATKQFLALGILKLEDVKNEDKLNRAYRKYLYHGISHHLGLDVHDLADKKKVLSPGMVLTVEPGIYIKEEGIGLRLENNILITPRGSINLSKKIPIKLDEIENLMRRY